MPYYVFKRTPQGDVNTKAWSKELEAYKQAIEGHFGENPDKPCSDFLTNLLEGTKDSDGIKQIIQKWDCKIGLTKDGLGVVSFTRKLTRQENVSVSDRLCSKEIRRLTEAPGSPDKTVSAQQLFNTE